MRRSATKETAHKKSPALAGLALTRRVTQLQEAKTPSREEFGTCFWQISQQRSPTTQTEPSRRCPTREDLPNSDLVPRHQRAFLQSVQCGADPLAYTGNTATGLMEHMSQKHGCQPLIQERVAQLRQLDRAGRQRCSPLWTVAQICVAAPSCLVVDRPTSVQSC